jgi:hypothetical protein
MAAVPTFVLRENLVHFALGLWTRPQPSRAADRSLYSQQFKRGGGDEVPPQ